MKLLIIGYGVVGKNMHKIFPKADVYDCNQPENCVKKNVKYDVAFVCVPTEMLPDGSCDTSLVEQVITEHDARVFCIKSTVPPGTTWELCKTGRPCVFSPEYFGATQHANGGDYNFVVIGGARELVPIVADAYKEVKPATFRILFTTSRTAEVLKYMENAWLATKVAFCCEFYRIAASFSVEYDELRELFIMDSRVNPSHTFVYRDHPWYDSHCLNKDVPAIIKALEREGFSADLLKAVVEINARRKEQGL